MDQIWGICKVIFSMNLVLLWFIVYASLNSDVLANVEFYPDVTPEDYVIEQLTEKFLQESQHRPFNNPGIIPQRRPDPEFTYHFPDLSSLSDETSHFAVSPSDPRYYEDSRSLTDNPEIIPDLYSRQSKRDEDYDRFPLDLNPESQNLGTTQQTEQKVYGEETENSNFARVQQHDKTDTASEQIYKTPVSADPGHLYFTAIVVGCYVAAVFALLLGGVVWYKVMMKAKAAADVEYPAYGVTGPNKEISPTGDRRLAQSAQMYHYQHQKQQIIAMESRVTNERNGSVSEPESEEENEEGDYTVYECPGLASTGEMEVKNPLFQDDPTPATPAVTAAPAAASGVLPEQVGVSSAESKK